MNILIVTSPHVSGVSEAIGNLISEGFVINQHSVTHITASKSRNKKKLIEVIKGNRFDLIFTLDPKNLFLRDFIKKAIDFIQCPIALFLLDHPVYHIDGIKRLADNSNQNKIYLLSPDLLHVELNKKYLCEMEYPHVNALLFPWASPVDLPYVSSKNDDLEFDIVAFCSLDAEIHQVESINIFLEKIKDELIAAYFKKFFSESVFFDLATPLEEHFNNAFGIDFSLSSLPHSELFSEFDSLTKKIRRDYFARQILRAVEEQNLKLCVCGTGWDNISSNNLNIKILGNVNYMYQFELYKKSHLVINLDPNWTEGIHDRVFNALACGCSVLTNVSKFHLNEDLAEHQLMQFSRLDEIPQKIASLIEHPRNSRSAKLLKNDWGVRVRELLLEIKKDMEITAGKQLLL